MDVQEIAALAIVILAAASLGLRLWHQARGKGGSCGGCGECGRPSSAPKATPLITLAPGSRPARPRSSVTTDRSDKDK